MKPNQINRLNSVPVQKTDTGTRIAREIAEKAFEEYQDQFNNGQSFERLHERGGFGYNELVTLLYLKIKRLEKSRQEEIF